jgi:hypothetical protein
MIVMASAAILHASRGDVSSAITTAILFALLTFVAYLRWKVNADPAADSLPDNRLEYTSCR